MEEWKNATLKTRYRSYQVSNLGNLRSIDQNGKIRVCKTHPNSRGYYNHNGVLIHRMVAIAFISNPKKLGYVNHIDFDKSNNSVDNLEWCTQKQNVRHAIENGQFGASNECMRGSKNHRSKLNEELVSSIRKSCFSNKIISQILHVCPETIKQIRNNKTWRHVKN